MKRVMAFVVLAILICLPCPAAGEKAASGERPLPPHPSKLEYGKLDFEVPDAAAYRHTLANGIPVYIAEDHDLPLVNISITLRVGSFLDPQSKPGLAAMTGTMLRRGGTASMTAEEFDEKIDFLAANIGSSTGDESGGASLNCITPVLGEALDLYFEMLRSPGFEQARIDVEKDNLLESMKQRNDRPASISSREWQWLMRGREHFSALRMTSADVEALTREDMIAFHSAYWRPEHMVISVSGDVDTEKILAELDKRFNGWKTDGPEVPWPPPAPVHDPKPGVYYVEKDIPQGRVLIGHLGYQRRDWDDPEVYALMVMNDILGGGGFTSRLVKRIRSDEGLAYSAGSGFGIGQWWPGVFRISYQSKSETVAFAAKIALEEIERIRSEPVSEDELAVAKASFVDAFPRRFESAGQIAGTFAADEYWGRPHAYWKTYRERIEAVDRKRVQAAAKRHLHPDRLLTLVVGDWAAIEPGDADGRASMKELSGGKAKRLPLRDPLTLEPLAP